MIERKKIKEENEWHDKKENNKVKQWKNKYEWKTKTVQVKRNLIKW